MFLHVCMYVCVYIWKYILYVCMYVCEYFLCDILLVVQDWLNEIEITFTKGPKSLNWVDVMKVTHTVCIYTYIHTYIHLTVCRLVKDEHLRNIIHSYIHTYIHTRTSIHLSIHRRKFIHTYIHTYIFVIHTIYTYTPVIHIHSSNRWCGPNKTSNYLYESTYVCMYVGCAQREGNFLRWQRLGRCFQAPWLALPRRGWWQVRSLLYVCMYGIRP